MNSDRDLPAAWLAIPPSRREALVSDIRDALEIVSADPEFGPAAVEIANRRLSEFGLKFQLLSFEQLGELFGLRPDGTEMEDEGSLAF